MDGVNQLFKRKGIDRRDSSGRTGLDKASGFADSSVEAYPSLKPQPNNMNIRWL